LPLALEDSGRDRRRSESERARRNFVFVCEVSNARYHQLAVAKLHEICTQDLDLRRDESLRNKILKIFPQMVFFKKQILGENLQRLAPSGRYNSLTI